MTWDVIELQNFIHDEAEFLDNGSYSQWLDLFAADGVYWVPRFAGQTDPLNEISLFYEDRALLEMRINRLQHPHIHSASVPYKSSHVVSAVRITGVGEDGDEVHVQSRFHMLEYHDGRERHFAGRYVHQLVREDGQLRIRLKRVDLVNCDAAFEPIEIPI